MRKDNSARSQRSTLYRILKRAMSDYGGWSAVIGSPFFWVSVLFSTISYRAWMAGGWADSAISIIPNLLGFSLGTYALLFSLMSNRLKLALRAIPNKKGVSYLNEINSTFLYFIGVQIFCLSFAFLYKQTLLFDFLHLIGVRGIEHRLLFIIPMLIAGYIGTIALFYSFLLVIASSLAIYRLARIVDPSTD